MDLSQILSLVSNASNMVNQLATLVPEIEANYAQVKGSLSEEDDAKLRAQIASLHQDTLSLTSQLDALRDAATKQ